MEISRNNKKKYWLSQSLLYRAEKACLHSVKILVWLKACVYTTFISSPPSLCSPKLTFSWKGLPGTLCSCFMIATSSLFYTKGQDWNQTFPSSSTLVPAGPSDQSCFSMAGGTSLWCSNTQVGCVRCQGGVAAVAQGSKSCKTLSGQSGECPGSKSSPQCCAALAVLAGEPVLGRMKLTLLPQHSLQHRLIAVQTHPKFLSLLVSLRTRHWCIPREIWKNNWFHKSSLSVLTSQRLFPPVSSICWQIWRFFPLSCCNGLVQSGPSAPEAEVWIYSTGFCIV